MITRRNPTQRGRPVPELRLTDEEQETLQRWARRPKSAQALALRSRSGLACAQGKSNTPGSAAMRLSQPTVSPWRCRFVTKRLEGPLEEPRPGAPQRRSGGTCVDWDFGNDGTHKTPLIQRGLVRHPRYPLHVTPTGASWINRVERGFATLTEHQLRRGVHRSRRDLEAAPRRYGETYNQDPKPFVWTKTADEILAHVAQFCQRTSDSGHRVRIQREPRRLRSGK